MFLRHRLTKYAVSFVLRVEGKPNQQKGYQSVLTSANLKLLKEYAPNLQELTLICSANVTSSSNYLIEDNLPNDLSKLTLINIIVYRTNFAHQFFRNLSYLKVDRGSLRKFPSHLLQSQ